MPITRFLTGYKTFDSRVIAAMQAAYVQALAAIGPTGERVAVQEIIAKRIIKAAVEGEESSDRLCDRALGSLGLKR